MTLKLVHDAERETLAPAEIVFNALLEPYLQQAAIEGRGRVDMGIFDGFTLSPQDYAELQALLSEKAASEPTESTISLQIRRSGLSMVGNETRPVTYSFVIEPGFKEPVEGADVYNFDPNSLVTNPYLGKKIYQIRTMIASEHGEDAPIVQDIDALIDQIRAAIYETDDAEPELELRLTPEIKALCLSIGQAAFAILHDFITDYEENEGWKIEGEPSQPSAMDVIVERIRDIVERGVDPHLRSEAERLGQILILMREGKIPLAEMEATRDEFMRLGRKLGF